MHCLGMCTDSSPLSSALEKRATPLAGLSKSYDGIVSPTVFSVITPMQDNTGHILECTSISRKVKDLRWSECYREFPHYKLSLHASRPEEGATSPWETHWAHQPFCRNHRHVSSHTGDPDTRGTPEGIGADNAANSHDFIMNLVMVNVYFNPGVIVS